MLSVTSSVISPTSEKGNILLVDDQPENLKLLSDLLEEQGYEVQQAINGVIALQAVAAGSPDVILLDIHMPELDGYTVCQKLKAHPQTQDIPVIFVSALDETWDKVKAFSVGGSDYITKPFKTVEVLARVENQLKVRHLQLKVKSLEQQLEEKNQQLQQLLQKL
ncbi:MAG: response regulator [Okeania sp. SIO3B3]|nr:response regulator [Okeania sp. SIO3B3]